MDLKFYDENNYLISMTPADKIIEAGAALGLNDKCSVFDLCCGYGEMLKLWAENFNIKGVGVDRCTEYVNIGDRRLHDAQLNNNITLIAEDVQNYITDEKFDIACLCGVGDLFGGIDGHISMLERFIKPTGKLVIAECFLNKESAPKEHYMSFIGCSQSAAGIFHGFQQAQMPIGSGIYHGKHSEPSKR